MGQLIFTNKDDDLKSAKVGYVSNSSIFKDKGRFDDINAIVNLYYKLNDGDEIVTYYDGIEVRIELNAAETYSLVEPEET